MQYNSKSYTPKKRLWLRWLLAGAFLLMLAINGAGLWAGNMIYEETSVLHSHLHRQNMDRFKTVISNKGTDRHWEELSIESRFGYSLHGTYIPNPQSTDKTLIFLHGFTESRAAGLYYMDIYLNSGYNILLVDSRAHGDSGGDSVTWGNYEKYDLDQWVDWVSQRFPHGVIGVHGISMGAATALMHAELNETGKRVAFYIADSSYSDFETLLLIQMKQRFSLSGTALPKILLQYANAAAYFNSRFTFYQASPVRSVRNVTTPILYIHGEADHLVPATMAQELYSATKGPRQLYMFPHAEHVAAIFDDQDRYGGVVLDFVRAVEQHS
ncbi:MAG TPA: alpha/beta hydrolase [Patescibacteria group bacterium]|nr:alpha/beta hydrolase [Patescibacteria group bacterium]